MEFTVVTAANLPPKPVLAIHVGNVRRQIKLEVNHPFVLPDPGVKPAHVEALYETLPVQRSVVRVIESALRRKHGTTFT
ncbi:unnamed protein product [Symbiodinium natans]|uniref:Uncharacterized protein n=1 Tax=Symbiodinium natans TaxID=878477 RepID=A0A812RUA2_9DINO|nr:unnamed protein product [Symbiodinium natans]